MKYFEEFRPGEKVELGSYTFTADAIKRFAAAFDPQPFHLDEDQAANSLFGGLCASGWHTAAIWMRLMVDNRQRASAAQPGDQDRPRMGPSPGFDELKWLKPVMAGETIAYSSEVVDLKDNRWKPQWGVVISRNEGRNQAGELVFSFIGRVFIERRPV